MVPGPSPRVRGSPHGPLVRPLVDGSIPACAGKPRARWPARPGRPVHPRVCGEAVARWMMLQQVSGPSPRVRGSRADRRGQPRGSRSIPACAGKPPVPRDPARRRGVHPRVCGEARALAAVLAVSGGPSPRVRGSLVALGPRRRVVGSIPACAGKPDSGPGSGSRSRVHPRVCGEASTRIGICATARGPSPRVRGSRHEQDLRRHPPGSIPACAGKPRPARASASASRVHPRVCGEAVVETLGLEPIRGPSPRVRGSPVSGRGRHHHHGSIPACAGKPSSGRGPVPRRGVHPRVCGEASAGVRRASAGAGPSPRVRGSRRSRTACRPRSGSIPACAGKPSASASGAPSRAVHPRVCGEALYHQPGKFKPRGPSPRVRGSPDG